jgi:hypothetical protein
VLPRGNAVADAELVERAAARVPVRELRADRVDKVVERVLPEPQRHAEVAEVADAGHQTAPRGTPNR